MQLQKTTPQLVKGQIYYRTREGANFADKYEFIRYTHTQGRAVFGVKCGPLGTRENGAVPRPIPSEIVDELHPITSKVLKAYNLEVEAGQAYAAIKKLAKAMSFVNDNAHRAAYIKTARADVGSMQLSMNYILSELHASDEQTRTA